MVFFHLIKPLRLASEGALWKNVSAFLAQEVRETCVPDKSTIRNMRKDEEAYYYQWTPQVLRPACHSTNKPTYRVSYLAWASLTQASSLLLVPRLRTVLLTPQTGKHPWPISSLPPYLVLFHFHLRTGNVLSITWTRLGHFHARRGSASQSQGRMTKRLVPGQRPSHRQGSAAGLGQRLPLCKRQKRALARD